MYCVFIGILMHRREDLRILCAHGLRIKPHSYLEPRARTGSSMKFRENQYEVEKSDGRIGKSESAFFFTVFRFLCDFPSKKLLV